ncbi:MAG: cell division protein SepF [Eubacteriales bacterium]
MGIFDKFKDIVYPEDQEEYSDEEYVGQEELYDDEPAQFAGQQPVYGTNQHQQQPSSPYNQQPTVQRETTINKSGQGISVTPGSSLELKVVKPDKFESVEQIGEHLLNRKTVVLNLEDTNKETARRMIDFLTGVAFAIGGQLKRVSNSTFVITPSNVDVSNDLVREEAASASIKSGLY